MHGADLLLYKIASSDYKESTILDCQLLEKSCIVFGREGPLAPDTKPSSQTPTAQITGAISEAHNQANGTSQNIFM